MRVGATRIILKELPLYLQPSFLPAPRYAKVGNPKHSLKIAVADRVSELVQIVLLGCDLFSDRPCLKTSRLCERQVSRWPQMARASIQVAATRRPSTATSISADAISSGHLPGYG